MYNIVPISSLCTFSFMHMCRPILNFETKCVEFEIFNHVNFTICVLAAFLLFDLYVCNNCAEFPPLRNDRAH